MLERLLHAKFDCPFARDRLFGPVQHRVHEVNELWIQVHGDSFACLDMDALEAKQGLQRHTILAGVRRSQEAQHDVIGVHFARISDVDKIVDQGRRGTDGLGGREGLASSLGSGQEFVDRREVNTTRGQVGLGLVSEASVRKTETKRDHGLAGVEPVGPTRVGAH